MSFQNDHNTKHAEYNTVLANERTFSAWLRTGLTALATGLGVERFLGGVIPDPVIRAISMSLLLFSVLAFSLGAWRYIHVGALLRTQRVFGAPAPLLLLISILLAFASILAIIGVWLV